MTGQTVAGMQKGRWDAQRRKSDAGFRNEKR
jgi:hypothetical protein